MVFGVSLVDTQHSEFGFDLKGIKLKVVQIRLFTHSKSRTTRVSLFSLGDHQ